MTEMEVHYELSKPDNIRLIAGLEPATGPETLPRHQLWRYGHASQLVKYGGECADPEEKPCYQCKHLPEGQTMCDTYERLKEEIEARAEPDVPVTEPSTEPRLICSGIRDSLLHHQVTVVPIPTLPNAVS